MQSVKWEFCWHVNINFEDFLTLTIPVPTRIPGTPMAQPKQESIQQSSEDSTSPNSILVFHHVLNNVLKIEDDEVVSLQNRMDSLGYNNFLDLWFDFQPGLSDIHSYSGCRVEGQQCPLKFDTMNTLRMFISWVRTKIKDTPGTFHSDHFLLLTNQKFHLFGQEEISRMTKVPKGLPPGPTTPMTRLTSHTLGSKKRQAFLSRHHDLLHEPDFESTEERCLTKMGLILPIFTFSIFFQFF